MSQALSRALLVLLICGVSSPALAQVSPEPQLIELIKDIGKEREKGHALAVPEGVDPRYSKRLDDVSEQRYSNEASTLGAFADRLNAIDRSLLPEALQTDAEIISRQLRDRLAELRFRAFEIPIGSREGFHFEISALPDKYNFDKVADFDDYIAKLQSFKEHADQNIALMRAGLKSGRTVPRDVLDRYDEPVAALIVDDVTKSLLYRPLTNAPASFAADDRERFLRDGTAALRNSVMPGLKEFLTFLRAEYLPGARATLGLSALQGGDALYRHRILMHTTLELSPQEVHETGKREVARIRTEMEQVIRSTGFKGTFAEFIKFLQDDPRFTVDSEEKYLQAVALAAKRMDGALPKIFSLLPRTPYGIRPMPERIAIRQSAGYYDSGDPDGTRAGFVNVNTSDLKARPLYVAESLAFHEGVPGHHLQIMRARENKDLSDFRRKLGITVFVEGWGLYAERLGREVGFYQDPYSDFGRLTYEIWRAVRLVVDSGVHALGWTRAQAIAYMAENTGFKIGPSTAEVDRHITEAGQGLAYTFGMIKILELRKRAEEKLGSKFDLKAFHEAILGNGALPLDLLDREVSAWIEGAATVKSLRGLPRT
ncbi:MAG: DUF885 domain-containing protein [Vicinamibacteria bacterium]|nr:DUF885 domain-containing protein [Vicinamibacteria bacterium]